MKKMLSVLLLFGLLAGFQLIGLPNSATAAGSYYWSGSGDFFNYTNWGDGTDTTAPQEDLSSNVYFRVLKNDSGYSVPAGFATMGHSYTSTGSLYMGTGVNTGLTINNAIYTLKTAYIGQANTNGYNDDPGTPAGTALVNLNNATISGTTIVGVNLSGVLNASGTSSIIGNLTLARDSGSDGTLNIAEDAYFSITGTWYDGAGDALIYNQGNLTLADQSIAVRNSSGAETLDNAGGTLIKTGTKTATINWNVINDGYLDVQEGTLSITSGYQGTGVANIADDAHLNLTGTLTADAELDAYGRINPSLGGSYALTLGGDYTVYTANNSISLSTTLKNKGKAVLAKSIYDYGNDATAWTNLSGGTLELIDGSGFIISYSNGTEILSNEAGAEIKKTGTGTSTVQWDVVNDGILNVQEGTLNLTGGFGGTGTGTVAQGATLNLTGTLTADASIKGSKGIINPALGGSYALTLGGDYTVDTNNFGVSLSATIKNRGNGVLKKSIYDYGNDATAWYNLTGSKLELTDGSGFIISYGNGTEILSNETGATITKTGADASTIQWDVENDGALDVQEGILSLTQGYEGTGTAAIATGALLNLTGKLTDDSFLTVSSGGWINPGLGETAYTLTLDGNYAVYTTGSYVALGCIIENRGTAVMESSIKDFGNTATGWHNIAGSSLELSGESGFHVSYGSGTETLTNDSGAAITKTGEDTTATVDWNVVNNGALNVQGGTLTFTQGYEGTGTATIADGGLLNLTGLLTADSTLKVNGGWINPSLGDTAFTLTLGGEYTIYTAGSYVSLGSIIQNQGTAVLASSIKDFGNTATAWHNLFGGSLAFTGDNSLYISYGNGTETLENDDGATISKSGEGTTSAINWDLINNGRIDVEEGTLTFTSGFEGDGTATIAEGALLNFTGKLTADSSLKVTGGRINPNLSDTTYTLTLDGDYTVYTTGSYIRLGSTIENKGAAVLASSIKDYGTKTTAWHNLAGGSLEIAENSEFLISYGNGTEILENDIDATIRKTGEGTSRIYWNVVNNGDFDVEKGLLSVYADVEGSGSFKVAAKAALYVAGGVEFQTHTLALDQGSSFNFDGDRLEVVDFIGDFTQDRGIYAPGASPAVSTLTGDYTMTSNAKLEIELGGTALGDYDQLSVFGDVTLTHGSLQISLVDDFTLSVNEYYLVLIIDGTLTGTFLGLDEGDLIGLYDSVELFITYTAGDGNDIALYTTTAPVPLPGSVWLLGAGILVFASVRRRNS